MIDLESREVALERIRQIVHEEDDLVRLPRLGRVGDDVGELRHPVRDRQLVGV